MLKKQGLKSEDIREVTFYAAPELKAEKKSLLQAILMNKMNQQSFDS